MYQALATRGMRHRSLYFRLRQDYDATR